MYKKPTQTPTYSANASKKSTKMPQRSTLIPVDKKNETGNSEFKNRDEQLLAMVRQHLQFCGYVRSFEMLKNERPNLRAKVNLSQQQVKADLDKNHIMQLFDKGLRQEFFKQASKVFTSDESAKRLEFQINVYFCVYNIHPFLKRQQTIDKSSAQAFKKYLDTKGADLSETSQFLSFFALPFMPKPQQHKALAHIFTKEWIAKLKNKLAEHLGSHLKSSNAFMQNNQRKVSQLQELYYGSLNSINSSREDSKENYSHSLEIEHLKKENNELRIIIQNYHKKFEEFTQSSKINLLQSNQKWFSFSRQIFLIAKKYIKQDKAKILDKYNSFFVGNIDDHIQANEISLFDKNSYLNEDITPDLSKQRISLKRQETAVQNCQIDHVRIRGIFLLANHHEKQTEICMILKALKKRLTKKSESAQRREIIIEYSRVDVCGVNEENYIIQKKLLFDGGDRVKLYYLKLMEILTTDALGLQYLIKSKKLVQNLVGILSIQHQDSRMRKPVLGILQRISFSKAPRMQMIKLGIIPIIFNIFRTQGHEISDFTVQFSIATWMNLSLKRESYPDFEKHKSELIAIVMDQMVSPIENIRDYINGTIFLLLTSKQIRAEALRQKMDVFIKKLIDTKAENTSVQQFVYILDRLTGNEQEETDCHDEDSDSQQEQVDGGQFQDDQEGSLSQSSDNDFSDDMQIANGEQYLVKNYALLGPQAMREHFLTKSVLDETSKRLNNMTTSINRSRRLDNIFQGKGNATVLEPELDNILNRKKGILQK